MKKLISTILCLALLLGLATTALAASPTVYQDIKVYFTGSSSFEAGGTVTVDEAAIMNDGDIQADVWNAILEGRVKYTWHRNDTEYKEGESIRLTDADKGYRFYCQASVYEDAALTQMFGVFFSEDFYVPATGSAANFPEITTESLPDGYVGEEYYLQLECTDPDVSYSLFRSSLPDGLNLTQHGEIEGTPTKAGFWYVVVMATPEAGADYATTAEYEFYINEEDNYCELEIMEEPDKWQYVSGETLDLTGMWVRIWTSDGYRDSFDGEGLTYTKDPLTTVGDQKIKVSYGDAFAIFMVVVEPAPEVPTEEPTEDATEEPSEEIPEVPVDGSENAPDVPGGELTTGTQNGTQEPTEEELPEMLDGPGYEGVPAPSPVLLWIVIAAALVAVIAAVVIVVVVISKRKKG